MEFKERVSAMGAGGGEVQAAQQIAQMNAQKAQAEAEQAAQQGDKTDEAAMLLAEAEMVNAQTDMMKEEFEIQHKVAQYELDKEKLELEKLKEIGKMIAIDTKLAGEIQKLVLTKGLDAQIEALKAAAVDANEEKMRYVDAEIQSTMNKVLKDNSKDNNEKENTDK
jgi:hypothetical protein